MDNSRHYHWIPLALFIAATVAFEVAVLKSRAGLASPLAAVAGIGALQVIVSRFCVKGAREAEREIAEASRDAARAYARLLNAALILNSVVAATAAIAVGNLH